MNPADTDPGVDASGLAFDRASGSWLERLLFNHRPIIIALCVLVTAAGAYNVPRLQINTSFESLIPTDHPFIINYLRHKEDVRGLSNTVRIVVETNGSVLDRQYLEALKAINDQVFLLPGVDRAFMRSLWTPGTRWLMVTEEGMDGGPVMPFDYDGSATAIEQLRTNIERSGQIGQLVSPDFKSSIILVPLIDVDQETGRTLDYGALAAQLEAIRAQYQGGNIQVHIVGFAKIVGDLIAGFQSILRFFFVSVAIAVAFLFWYTRCVRSTALVVLCSLTAVIWQLGLLPVLGFKLDPYSVLVPFLVFAIGMSHGAQKMNGVMQDIGRGAHRLVAARMTFRRLFLAGLTALICDAVGFAVMLLVRIPAIQQLAIVASIGVGALVFTNLILLPLLLSYTGVSRRAADRALQAERRSDGTDRGRHLLWRTLALFTRRRYASTALLLAALIGVGGFVIGQRLKVGDLDRGAPELRPESRYNRDNAYLIDHYATSTDIFVIMAETQSQHCVDFANLATVDLLEQTLRELPGVESVQSLADLSRQMEVGLNEGAFRWYELLPNQASLNEVFSYAPRELYNQDCSLLNVFVYLQDHKAQTLSAVVEATAHFAAVNDRQGLKFVAAAGNAGIEAATNIVVRTSNRTMLLYVYGAVILLSLVAFRSFRAVLTALLPLVLTSILAGALMVIMNIGVKVATLPVTALGVGIGVDYALYILTVTLAGLRSGATLSEAYYRALLFTGKVVMLTGFTLAAAVATWAFSPIKFQADMGILLAFMFLVNMVGALILLPALANFLLQPRRSVAVTRPG